MTQILDFLPLIVIAVASLLIGLIVAIRAGKWQTIDDYLVGNRKMAVVATALSLCTNFVPIILYTHTTEIYNFGMAIIWSLPGACLAIVFTAVFLHPVLYHTKAINLYSYLEERFDSKLVKFYSSVLFAVLTFTYSTFLTYTSASILAIALGIPTWTLVLSISVVCGVYTTMGGIRAVVWTSAIQTLLVYAALTAVVTKGLMAYGGIESIWQTVTDTGRTAGIENISPNPLQHMTAWTALFGGMFVWLSAFGANQMVWQRYASVRTATRSRLTILINIPIMSLLFAVVAFCGLLMVTFAANRDILINEYNSSLTVIENQLLVKFMLSVMSGSPVLRSLLAAGILCVALSGLSAGINSLAAVCWDSFVGPCLRDVTDLQAALFVKGLTVICTFGIAALAFFTENLRSLEYDILTIIEMCTAGPLIGLMLLGILVPWANWFGALIGALIATSLTAWLSIGRNLNNIDNLYVLPDIQNATSFSTHFVTEAKLYAGHNTTFSFPESLYTISGYMLPVVGCVAVLLFGAAFSVCKRSRALQEKPDLVFWGVIGCTKQQGSRTTSVSEWAFFDAAGARGERRTRPTDSFRARAAARTPSFEQEPLNPNWITYRHNGYSPTTPSSD